MITGHLYLDWAILAISLFNMVLLLWLGGTVLLNAERRTWGHALAGGGLLLAGLLFLAHTAIVGRGLNYIGRWMDFWWGLGWLPALIAPFAWYLEMLWYGGFWDDSLSSIRKRHRLLLPFTVLLALLLTTLPILDPHPLPSYADIATYNWANPFSLHTLPLLILIYPFYSVLCFALSLDALRRPGASNRIMGELARLRARPWLVGTALSLLAVSLIGTGSLVWLIGYGRQQPLYLADGGVLLTLAWLDLITASLIAGATLLLGQAVTRYEIFTGKTLPRRGLSRHWQSAVILAAGYGLLVGGSLALQLHPIYGLLLSTILMVVFYALFSWRSYIERERYIERLRPFVASQRLYEDVIAGPLPPSPSTPGIDAITPFRALCQDVLGTRVAYLAAVGPLSPLVGPPLTYSDGSHPHNLDTNPHLPLAELASQLHSPQTICVPLPSSNNSARWAVPLWSERGLIGILFLGDKRDGGLYAQEEIEIARAVGERLIDTQASVAMAQRLMGLQRQRLAETQVLDRRARRVLHDDVLPLLHTSMLVLSNLQLTPNGSSHDPLALLADAHSQISALLREMPSGAAPEVGRFGLIGALKMVVDEEFAHAFDTVTWHVEPEADQQLAHIPTLAADVLFYAAREAIRNAARHARPSAQIPSADPATTPSPLSLTITASCHTALKISIRDNGIGIDPTRHPTEGAGQGLALHSTLMAVIGGSLSIQSVPSQFTRVELALPQPQLPQPLPQP